MLSEDFLGYLTMIITVMGWGFTAKFQYQLKRDQELLKREIALELQYIPSVILEMKNFREWLVLGLKLTAKNHAFKEVQKSQIESVKKHSTSLDDSDPFFNDYKYTTQMLNENYQEYLLWSSKIQYYFSIVEFWEQGNNFFSLHLETYSSCVIQLVKLVPESKGDKEDEWKKVHNEMKESFRLLVSSTEDLIREQYEIN